MSTGINAVKVTAKTVLKGNWLRVIAVCLIIVFTDLIGTYTISLLSMVLGEIISKILVASFNIFLVLPLILGGIRYVWRMLFDADDSPLYIFYWFSSRELYKSAIHFIIMIILRVAGWLAILNIPTLLMYILSKTYVFDMFNLSMPLWAANLEYAMKFVQNASVIVTFVIMLKYYISPILFVADDGIDAAEALHMSKVISRKTGIDFIYLIFSFLAWIFLSTLVLPLIFTLPYMLTSYAVHVRFAVAEYNLHIENIQKENFNFLNQVSQYE